MHNNVYITTCFVHYVYKSLYLKSYYYYYITIYMHSIYT